MIRRFRPGTSLAVAALIALAGCAGTKGIAETETALTAAETAALAYVTQPACVGVAASATCPSAATKTAIHNADNIAYAAVQAAKKGTVSPADAAAAVAALTALLPK